MKGMMTLKSFVSANARDLCEEVNKFVLDCHKSGIEVFINPPIWCDGGFTCFVLVQTKVM